MYSDKRLFEQCDVFVRVEEQRGVPHVTHVDYFNGTTKELFVTGNVLFALGRVVLVEPPGWLTNLRHLKRRSRLHSSWETNALSL